MKCNARSHNDNQIESRSKWFRICTGRLLNAQVVRNPLKSGVRTAARPNAAADEIAMQRHDRGEAHRSVVSDLVSLIEHVQASVRLIESAIASEAAPDSQDATADVVVLDDVTPRYFKIRKWFSGSVVRIGPRGRITRHAGRVCSWLARFAIESIRRLKRSTIARALVIRMRG